ncbi:MAG: hypothetical protein K6G80_01640, partial [Treponema sp.]|nr:hypothetical protein [Treponema sp.]
FLKKRHYPYTIKTGLPVVTGEPVVHDDHFAIWVKENADEKKQAFLAYEKPDSTGTQAAPVTVATAPEVTEVIPKRARHSVRGKVVRTGLQQVALSAGQRKLAAGFVAGFLFVALFCFVVSLIL